MLALLAAHTTTLRLQTGILVLPYRNPFIVARDITTLDAFAGGRVTLSVGAGYLKGEYRALGVDFDQRNELMDEYLRVIRAATTGEEFAFEGSGYQAFGNRIIPGSPQKPGLPLYVGGNARRAIRRAGVFVSFTNSACPRARASSAVCSARSCSCPGRRSS